MTKAFDLEFCFKGNRKYVHGTDIFTNLTKHLNRNIKKIDIAFHGISLNNMRFSTEKVEDTEVKVTFRCHHDANKIKLFGIETNKDIDCHYEYLEENIITGSIINIEKKTITLSTPTQYSFIEHIVAMNKALLEKLYNNINGKWYFTRLQLSENIQMNDVSSLQLILTSNFQFKLTKSTVIVNDEEAGFIYFSHITQES